MVLPWSAVMHKSPESSPTVGSCIFHQKTLKGPGCTPLLPAFFQPLYGKVNVASGLSNIIRNVGDGQ